MEKKEFFERTNIQLSDAEYNKMDKLKEKIIELKNG